jgi:hypothetical protein
MKPAERPRATPATLALLRSRLSAPWWEAKLRAFAPGDHGPAPPGAVLNPGPPPGSSPRRPGGPPCGRRPPGWRGLSHSGPRRVLGGPGGLPGGTRRRPGARRVAGGIPPHVCRIFRRAFAWAPPEPTPPGHER